MKIAERIKEEREKRGLSQEQLAEKIGVDRTTIVKYETGASRPTRKVKELSAVLGLSAGELVGIEVTLHADTVRNVSKPDIKEIGIPVTMIPIYGRIAGGEPRDAVEDIIGYLPVAESEVAHGEFYALKVFGASMSPTITDGNVIIVKKQETVDDGQIAVVLIGDESTVKRVYRDTKGISIVADNAAIFRPRHYTDEEIENIPIRILGRAVKVSRDL